MPITNSGLVARFMFGFASIALATTTAHADDGTFGGVGTWIVALARLGSIGIAFFALYLGYDLVRNGKPATAYFGAAVFFFLVSASIEVVKYMVPRGIMLSLSPNKYPPKLHPQILANGKERAMENGEDTLDCAQTSRISFHVDDLMEFIQQSNRVVRAAAAPDAKKPDSDFGPDIEGGAQ